MIIGIQGTLGQGKTTALVAFSLDYKIKTGLPIYSNMSNFKGSDRTIDNLADMIGLTNCIFAFDEIWNTMDSRDWKTHKGKLTEWIMNMRKKNVLLIYTSQNLGQVEKRLRDVTDLMVLSQKKKWGFEWLIFDWQTKNLKKKIRCRNPQIYYNQFDTYEMPKSLKSSR